MKSPLLALLVLIAALAVARAAEPSLAFAKVLKEPSAATREMSYDFSGKTLVLHGETTPIVADADFERAEILPDGMLKLWLTETGEKKFDEAVKDWYQKQIAIVINGRVVCAPSLMTTSSFGGEFTISHNLPRQEAEALVASFPRKGGQ
jgi:preprotein translocase subunit SecD